MRGLFLVVSAAILASTQSLCADEVTSADIAPLTHMSAQSLTDQGNSAQDLYIVCAFYPKPGTCESVYQRAMKDESISAEAVRAEYTGYVRYLGGAGSLTQADRQYLKDNQIMVPDDLSPANQAGLHNVITDTSLSSDARRAAVNNFLSRAVEAELYCGFNSCADAKEQTGGVYGRALQAHGHIEHQDGPPAPE